MKKLIIILITVITLTGCKYSSVFTKDGVVYRYKNGAMYDEQGRKYHIGYTVKEGKYKSYLYGVK